MRRRLTVLLICALASLLGAASPSRADTTTQLPLTPGSETWLIVDPAHQHVFVTGGEGNSSIVVLNYDGSIDTTITGEAGASGMALDPATNTLYVALDGASSISEIDTQALTETARFTAAAGVYSLALAGGKLWFATATQGPAGSISYANLDGSGITGAPFGSGEPTLLTASADGKLLAFGDHETEPPNVDVYDVSGSTPTLVSSAWDPNDDTADVSDLTFDPSGTNLLLASGAPYFIQAFSFATSTLTLSTQYDTGPYPDAVAVSPDGNYVAAARSSPDHNLYIFPTGKDSPIRIYTAKGPLGHDMAFSPDGTKLFYVTGDDSTHLGFEVLENPLTPDSNITSGPTGSTYATNASFAFTSDDTAATFQCSLDGSTPQSCSSPADYSDLAFGPHTFTVQAVDGTLVDPTGTSQTWTVTPPDTHLTAFPDNPTYSTSASFSFTSDDSAATFQCSLDNPDPSNPANWQTCASPTDYSGLSVGSHTFSVRAVNDAGAVDPAGVNETWVIDPAPPPSANLNASPSPVVTGGQVTLDASGSVDPFNAIVDYQWDLGNGSFDEDTGSTPTATTSFPSPGHYQVRVKVTDTAGESAIATATVEVALAPPPGPVGISINNGDYATNSPDVQLDVVWPAFAENALISNDGGFGPNGGTSTVPVAPAIPWTLASDGSERLPQIVYLRFPDSANPTVTFTDNIVLDTTTPAVQNATLIHKTAKLRSTQARGHRYKVRLHAKETISGISQVRFSSRRSGGTALTLRNRTTRGILNLSRTISLKLSAAPKWVRVRSTAGNWSKWHRVR